MAEVTTSPLVDSGASPPQWGCPKGPFDHPPDGDVPAPLSMDHGFVMEIASLQELMMLDFDQEFSEFLRHSQDISIPRDPGPPISSGRRGSRSSMRNRSSSSTGIGGRRPSEVYYSPDGTIACADLTYDSLCSISSRSSLEQLSSLTLSVSCRNSSDTLSIIARCIPGLATLRLDNSRFRSLRVLGQEMPSLKTLSVCGCGLTDLDGISYAPKLVNLIAAFNRISDVYPITELNRINTVDLESNSFDDYASVSFLFICPRLENLVLKGNRIASDTDYRQRIFEMLPRLKNLDVVLAPRAQPTHCRWRDHEDDEDRDKDKSSENNNGAPKLPKEFQGLEEPQEKIPDKGALLKDAVVQKFIKDDSPEVVAIAEEEQPPSVPDPPLLSKVDDKPSRQIQKLDDHQKAARSKLLDRRKSLGPARIRDDLAGDAQGNGQLLTSKGQHGFQQQQPATIGMGTTALLDRVEDKRDPAVSAPSPVSKLRQVSQSFSDRSDSAMSSCTNASVSLSSDADSGVEVSCKLPRLGRARGGSKGSNYGTDGSRQESPSARTKREDKAKLVRTSSNLEGILRREGDVEIEDFD